MTAPKPDLDAIKARLAKATPGPWATNRVLVTVGAPCRWRSFVVRPDVPPAYDIRVATPGDGTSKGDESPDADLIAHAPTDLAALVAEVEDLREYLRAAEQAHLRHDAEAERLSDRLTSAEEENAALVAEVERLTKVADTAQATAIEWAETARRYREEREHYKQRETEARGEAARLSVALAKSDALGLETLAELGAKTSENARLAEQLLQPLDPYAVISPARCPHNVPVDEECFWCDQAKGGGRG